MCVACSLAVARVMGLREGTAAIGVCRRGRASSCGGGLIGGYMSHVPGGGQGGGGRIKNIVRCSGMLASAFVFAVRYVISLPSPACSCFQTDHIRCRQRGREGWNKEGRERERPIQTEEITVTRYTYVYQCQSACPSLTCILEA